MSQYENISFLGGGVLTGYGISQYLGKKKGNGTLIPLIGGLALIGYGFYCQRNKTQLMAPVAAVPAATPRQVQSISPTPRVYYTNNPSFENSVYYSENVSGNANPAYDKNHVYPGVI